VHGDHGPGAEQQGEDVVGLVKKIDAEPPHLGGQAPVFAYRVPARLVHHRHEVLREVLQRRDVLVVAEEEVGVLVINEGQRADDVPHIRADAVVPPLAGINRDSRHTRR
jgi:hypothetical protein